MRTPLSAILIAAALAGCGSAPAPNGAHIFANSCSSCHTLHAGGGRVPPGGPLDGYSMSAAQVESFVKTMPVRRPLSEAERRAVAEYVAQVQRAGK